MSVFVKICGITSEEDALLAIAMGADALGFVFAPSPRQVQPGVVSDIVKRLPPEILTVGVFRDEAPDRVAAIVNSAGLLGAQLHGHEPPATTRAVKQHVQFVIKAFAAGDRAVDEASAHKADAVLIDAPQPGSGELFDWSLTLGVPDRAKLIVAGGLDAGNVAAAVLATDPWGVDVATGVESAPGRKDPVKLRAFIAAAKSVTPPSEDRRRRADAAIDDEARPFDWTRDAR